LILKLQKKIDLISLYIIPRFIYRLMICPSSESTLILLDSEIGQPLKEILHLTPSTRKHFFYAKRINEV
jgi:hypothetical protein